MLSPRLGRAAAILLITLAAEVVVYRAYHLEPPRTPTAQNEPPPPPIVRYADFAGQEASVDARKIANWVVNAGDNQALPFVVVDKVDAKVFVFKPDGNLISATPALLGSARGDDSVPGIGDKKISEILPDEKTTPAGRFVAERGRNLNGEDILWVDYDAAVSLHAIRANNPKERRVQRLASPSPADNRISYGCINVPLDFYRNVVMPAFTGTRGIVYVLPETRPARAVFASSSGE